MELDLRLRPTIPKVRDDSWRKGPRITKENMDKATGVMQRATREDWGDSAGHKGGSRPTQVVAAKDGGRLGFGKHKDMTLEQVYTREPGYWSWMEENVEWIQPRLKKWLAARDSR